MLSESTLRVRRSRAQFKNGLSSSVVGIANGILYFLRSLRVNTNLLLKFKAIEELAYPSMVARSTVG